MNHHSRFDQLVAATEELIHENERMRTKYTAFEAALQEVVDNQKALWRAAQSHIRGYPLTMQHLEGDEAHRPSHIVAQVRPALGGTVTPAAKVAAARRRNTKRQVLDAPPDLIP